MRNIIKMRKSFVAAVGLAALMAGGITAVRAAPASHNVPDALSGMPCLLLDGNGRIATSQDFKLTATQSPNGNAVFQCKGNVAPANSGGDVRWDATSAAALFGMSSVPCLVPVRDPTLQSPVTPTEDWEENVSASGEAMMTCHLPQGH
jgi:hypothetical protein